MSPSPEPPTVLRRRTPPVHAHTVVRSDAHHTFDVFVRTIATWWPRHVFSTGRERVRDLAVERRVGGRVYETWDDGTVVDWGVIEAWEPPARFVMTWNGTPRPTEVEFRFAALGRALTRVTVEHRGWEALTDEELARDCALPGGYASGAYATGWSRILAAFTDAREGAA